MGVIKKFICTSCGREDKTNADRLNGYDLFAVFVWIVAGMIFMGDAFVLWFRIAVGSIAVFYGCYVAKMAKELRESTQVRCRFCKHISYLSRN